MAEPLRGGRTSDLASPITAANCGNLLLRALDPRDFALIRPYLEPVPLDCGHVLVAQDDRIAFVCFPESGLMSVADVLADGTRIEVALIGRDGMTNSQLLLGCRQASHEAAVQIGGGRSLRLRADLLRELTARCPSAQALFLRYVHALAVQTVRNLTSHLRDSAEMRLPRWLLMCHDRIDGDEIRLSHKQVGRMLGVRRATVTVALHMLEGHGAVRSSRGRIVVRNRPLLETLAGSSYGFAEDRYSRIIAPFGKGAAKPLPAHDAFAAAVARSSA